MILGTTKACPSCSGACASTFSRGSPGRGSSARKGRPASASPAKLSGNTPDTSTCASRSMYSSTCPSCAAKRSSSSGARAGRARPLGVLAGEVLALDVAGLLDGHPVLFLLFHRALGPHLLQGLPGPLVLRGELERLLQLGARAGVVLHRDVHHGQPVVDARA